MKKGFLIFLLTIFVASMALPQSATTPKKSPSTKSAAARKGRSSSRTGKTAPSIRTARQTVPTPDRYRDIQQALVTKGYLKSEPNGVWDTQSADALRQFQTDQKLSPTGKISSATLIGLGLGPKTSAEPPKPADPKAEASPTAPGAAPETPVVPRSEN
jgi:peptidoglycan hydrolase-like protein with peptidoglycan-binding domain